MRLIRRFREASTNMPVQHLWEIAIQNIHSHIITKLPWTQIAITYINLTIAYRPLYILPCFGSGYLLSLPIILPRCPHGYFWLLRAGRYCHTVGVNGGKYQGRQVLLVGLQAHGQIWICKSTCTNVPNGHKKKNSSKAILFIWSTFVRESLTDLVGIWVWVGTIFEMCLDCLLHVLIWSWQEGQKKKSNHILRQQPKKSFPNQRKFIHVSCIMSVQFSTSKAYG